MNVARCFAIALILLALAGCTGYGLVEAAKAERVAGSYGVTADRPWNKRALNDFEVWTQDGPNLQAIRFFKPRSAGDRLISARANSDAAKRLPTFRPTMRPTDIEAFVLESLTIIGVANLEAQNLRPAKFGGNKGFRFDLFYTNRDGLKYKGFAVGSVIEERLYLVIYSGTAEHYYDRYLPAAEEVVRSLTL